MAESKYSSSVSSSASSSSSSSSQSAATTGNSSSNSFTDTKPSTSRPPSPGPNDDAQDLDCNICLFASSEPVVSRCGHLYCWACLHKWYDAQHVQQASHVANHTVLAFRPCFSLQSTCVLTFVSRLWPHVSRLQAGHADCPVCKTVINKKGDIIPLYGRSSRNNRHSSTTTSSSSSSSTVPPRPTPYPSSSSTPNSHFSSSNTFTTSSNSATPHVPPPFASLFGPSFNFHSQHGTFSFSAGYGLFPAIFGLQFAAFQLQELLRGGSGAEGSGVGGERSEGGVVGGGGGGGEVGSNEGDARLSRFLMFLGVFMLLLLLMY